MSGKKQDQLTLIVNFLSKTEGRDKLCKSLQYLARMLKHHYINDKARNEQFTGLANGMGDARKLFRLLKTLQEIQGIIKLLADNPKTDRQKTINMLQVIQKLLLAFYWLFDNWSILTKVKFLSGDFKPRAKTGMTFWFFSILVSLFVQFLQIQNIKKDIAFNEKYPSEDVNMRKKLDNSLKDCYLNIIKCVGDILPSGVGSEILPTYFKINPNEGLIGFGGLVSGVLACYQTF